MASDQSRSILLGRLLVPLGGDLVSAEMRALCEVCDIAKVRQALEDKSKDELLAISDDCRAALGEWVQRITGMEDDESVFRRRSDDATTPRSATLSCKAGARDGGRCVVTKERVSEVCHVFPSCLGRRRDQRGVKLWSVLRMFCGEEDTAALQSLQSGPAEPVDPAAPTSIDPLANLITLSPMARDLWSKGIFALKHISGGSFQGTAEMVLELEWLPQHPELSRGGVSLSQPVENTSASFLKDHALVNVQTRRPIDSGYRFTLRTHDKDNLPLPDERLVRLQWLLTRALRMSGAAEPKDPDFGETHLVYPVPPTSEDLFRPLVIRGFLPRAPSEDGAVPRTSAFKRWIKKIFTFRRGSGGKSISDDESNVEVVSN